MLNPKVLYRVLVILSLLVFAVSGLSCTRPEVAEEEYGQPQVSLFFSGVALPGGAELVVAADGLDAFSAEAWVLKGSQEQVVEFYQDNKMMRQAGWSLERGGSGTDSATGETVFYRLWKRDSDQVVVSIRSVDDASTRITLATPVIFPDKWLSSAVHRAADAVGPLTGVDLERVTELVVPGENIEDLSGIAELANLTTLDLSRNRISDIGPLRHLSSLEVLDLRDNHVRDIQALARENLPNLRLLYLENNDINLAAGTADRAVVDNLLASGCDVQVALLEDPGEFAAVVPGTGYATYQDNPVEITPAASDYQVAADLSNITNRDDFTFSSEAQELLVRNGFVVVPGRHREYFMLYEINRYSTIPNFITTDSLLHNYHLFFSHLLRVIEKEQLVSKLEQLTDAMLTQSLEYYQELKGTAWENAAMRNVAFFAVAGKLLDTGMEVPAMVAGVVDEELALIDSHRGIDPSPLMNLGGSSTAEGLMEDYSQYIPRGHYNTDELSQYFKAMMWYGRLTFRLKSEDETRSAVLITRALDEGTNLATWDVIYEPTNFFVGKSDDITYSQYKELLIEAYGDEPELEELVSSQDKWVAFLERAAELEPPQINSMPIFDEETHPDREREIKGFRFMGQRFTLDASIFQRLIYREVKTNETGARRMLPMGLDIPAALGSEEAYAILDSMGETHYKNYPENMAKMREFIANLDGETWQQNLYWGWLHALKPLVVPEGEGYPPFMRNTAWVRKELNTFLGSWTELKHDTILYAKQVYAEMGGGYGGDDRGYVEPNPEVYGRVASLVRMTREGLLARGLLSIRDKESLMRLEELALSLKTISEKELSDTPLSDEDYDLICSYGGQLEHFWLDAMRDEGIDHRSAISNRPAALIADVATDPNGGVLEEATGYVYEIYVVVPVDGSLRITKGGVYSYYEFTWPLSDRLTDQKWREMLDSGQAPALPEWTNAFVAP